MTMPDDRVRPRADDSYYVTNSMISLVKQHEKNIFYINIVYR
jgi:hypothetical protein